MSSATTTIPPSLTADQLTVIVASGSCLVFLVVILLLLAVLYRKDPLCCICLDQSSRFTDDPPQYHNSRHSLVGYRYDEHSADMAQDGLGTQLPGRMFIIGKPSSYHLDGPLPRLPTYESVRKKDRQRQIHRMIADRFGIGPTDLEPPPTYEETVRRSVDFSPVDLQSVDTQSFPSHLPSTAPRGGLLSWGSPQRESREPLSL